MLAPESLPARGRPFAFIVPFDMLTMSFLLRPIGGNALPLALFG
jgi:putative spermidine/putrescine transport system permease protein